MALPSGLRAIPCTGEAPSICFVQCQPLPKSHACSGSPPQVKEKKAAHTALVKERLLLEKKMGKKRSEADKKVRSGRKSYNVMRG